MTNSKGFPLTGETGAGWSIFDDGVPYPVAALLESALDHNGATMRSYCERHGVSLAPHGKTTMAPAIFRRQIDDGAWAITAANVWQAKIMFEAGVERIIIANEVVVPSEIAWLAQAMAQSLDVYCCIDSVDGIEIMEAVLDRSQPDRPLPVLLERGVNDGRTGVRNLAAGLEVAEAANASPYLALTGVAGFEGVISGTEERSAGGQVDEFLDDMVELTHTVAERDLFRPTPEVIVSAGGSAYFDHVVDRFSRISLDEPLRVVIRSGCYITHDDGSYDASSPMGQEVRVETEGLRPAIEVWGAVLSRPEPTRALVGIGKRDASPDGLLPLAKKVRRRGSTVVEEIDPIRVAAVNDQHAYLNVDASYPLAVGDLVGFGISHPCTTFDKWRAMAMVDDDYVVTEVVETHF